MLVVRRQVFHHLFVLWHGITSDVLKSSGRWAHLSLRLTKAEWQVSVHFTVLSNAFKHSVATANKTDDNIGSISEARWKKLETKSGEIYEKIKTWTDEVGHVNAWNPHEKVDTGGWARREKIERRSQS